MADVLMPKLGESVTEGTLGKWFKKIGDPVAKYEPLVEVVTDKVNAEIPSDFEGVLTEIFVQEGHTVPVGTLVCRVQEAGEAATPSATPAPTTTAPATVSTAPATPAVKVSTGSATTGTASGRFSPAVLKFAQENSVDLAQVPGTGEGGRITRKDVLAFVAQGAHTQATPAVASVAPSVTPATISVAAPAPVAPSVPAQPAQSSVGTVVSSDNETIIDPSPIRKTIARRMVESKHNAPHAWTMVETDVTNLAKFRDKAKVEFKKREGVDLTYLPFFIKAVAEALKQYPMLNAAWIDDKIHIKKNVNISIAVATDDALVVPVIQNADRLSVAGIAHAVHDLATRARAGRLTMTDVQGGTFTVNNTGAFGSILSQPIINAPQAAILSVESIVKRPVVVGDAIAIRHMVNLCLSLDHRLLDGWVSGQFLKAVKERLQSYNMDTVLY